MSKQTIGPKELQIRAMVEANAERARKAQRVGSSAVRGILGDGNAGDDPKRRPAKGTVRVAHRSTSKPE